MKVFMSWSGDISRKTALVFKEWLPQVIQTLDPYVSSEDIYKGARWIVDLSNVLNESEFGIVCVNPFNIEAPWLNFEAGALSKSVDKSRVMPFLLGVKSSEIGGPLAQFQATEFEKEEVAKLVKSLNNVCEAGKLEEQRLNICFEKWWPEFEENIESLNSEIRKSEGAGEAKGKAKVPLPGGEMIEEILGLVREQNRILSDPEAFIPRAYLRESLGKYGL